MHAKHREVLPFNPPVIDPKTHIITSVGLYGRRLNKLQLVRSLINRDDIHELADEAGRFGIYADAADQVIAEMLVEFKRMKESVEAALAMMAETEPAQRRAS